MFGKRSNDSNASTHFRSERISLVNGQFFFTTREGTLEGPYFTRADAQLQIERYLDHLNPADDLQHQPPEVPPSAAC